jgi:hypothetical protein
VIGLGDQARKTGRPIVRDNYRFHGGTSVLHNNRMYEQALGSGHLYIQNADLVSRFFRQFFMLKFSTIAFQMELLFRETPAAFEVHPGETHIILWSAGIPSGAWELLLTVVSL